MKLLNLLTFTTLSAVAVAWTDQVALEYASTGCRGRFNHAWIGSDRREIKMKNTTESVYITTVNDGIWRWYGFSESTEDGTACYGDLVARMYSPCFDLNSYVPKGKPKVECIQICSMLADKKHSYSCAAIGVTE
ncbi:hypothetical protein F4803DRAFT_304174 [Xylaria telfairii]|nr:hypothetical protein F4803DRAFT_304174 [Xylaria telfairii]